MNLAEAAPTVRSEGPIGRSMTGSGQASLAGCPFNNQSESLHGWIDGGLRCAAGRREFRAGRYFLSRFRSGREFAASLSDFRRSVVAGEKTGFLAIYDGASECASAAEELRLLGRAMREAGLTGDEEALIAGATLAHAVDLTCPVTGRDTTYEFFSVAFCRNAANPADPLYDPSLSAPFTAVNTTSDAYAFARLVYGHAMRSWGCAPHEMAHNRDAIEELFRKSVVAWQNMSITTIQNYNRVSVDPARAVHLTEDRRHWIAAHNDPVFAELEKCPHSHEMPLIYAARLCAKWSAVLYDGAAYVPGRDGQSGGVPVVDFDDIDLVVTGHDLRASLRGESSAGKAAV
jgi:hypothetical protein